MMWEFIAVIIIVLLVYFVVIPNWEWFLLGTVLIGVATFFIVRERKKRSRESQLEHMAWLVAQREQEKVMNTSRIHALFTSLNSYLCECFIIDTNIWMNEAYEAFFDVLNEVCTQNRYAIVLYGPQFDEIVNIKNGYDYKSTKGSRARAAINRIEQFQKNGTLVVKPISVDSDKRAYADPMIVRLFSKSARAGMQCAFISDDKELRIRVRQQLIDAGTSNPMVVEISDIIKECTYVVSLPEYQTAIGTPEDRMIETNEPDKEPSRDRSSTNAAKVAPYGSSQNANLGNCPVCSQPLQIGEKGTCSRCQKRQAGWKIGCGAAGVLFFLIISAFADYNTYNYILIGLFAIFAIYHIIKYVSYKV